MLSLTQEVKAQGRAFRQLQDALAQNLDLSGRQPEPGGEAGILDILLDMRDRVERSRRTSNAAAAELRSQSLPWPARWFGSVKRYARRSEQTLSALSEGCELMLNRLDEALLDLHISVMACEGKPFDPERMMAIEAMKTDAVPEGTVLEIYRNGYEREGRVYRTAQVKVARAQERNLH